jgi:hypothetical protein
MHPSRTPTTTDGLIFTALVNRPTPLCMTLVGWAMITAIFVPPWTRPNQFAGMDGSKSTRHTKLIIEP